ncbi:MAG: aldo/keto reductase [Jatrophihabitantaceae bacterium]
MSTPIRGTLAWSPLTLGCWNFGRTIDEQQSIRVTRAAIDAGVQAFDVADGYGKGQAEVFLGKGLRGRRDQALITTKFGAARGHGHRTPEGYRANSGGGQPDYLRSRLEQSLSRMGIDHVDLLQMHDPDPDTPIEETLQALDDLVRQGKIREYGCSNYTADQLRAAIDSARALGVAGFVSIQAQYSLLHQLPNRTVLPVCRAEGLHLLPYFALANGVLTGKYAKLADVPAQSRLGTFRAENRDDKLRRFWNPVIVDRVKRLTGYAADRGRSLLELALGWLLSQEVVPTVITGARTPEQIRANVEASSWRLTEDELAELALLLDDRAPLICDDLSHA